MADRNARREAKTTALVTWLQDGRPSDRGREHFAVVLRVSPGKTQQGAENAVDRQRDECLPQAERLIKDLVEETGRPVPIEVYCDVDRTAAEPDESTDLGDAALSLQRGKKAAKYERAEYDAMIEAIKDKRCLGFVTWKFDRMCRSPRELESLLRLVEAFPDLKVAGARDGAYRLDTVNGRMTARILAATAAAEVENLKDRRKAQLTQAYSWGLCTSRKPPGYKRIAERVVEMRDGKPTRKQNIEPVWADAEVIQAGWQAIFGPERRSYGWVAARWNDHMPWDTYAGAPWTPATVQNTLCSATLAGRIEAAGSKVIKADMEGAWEPILTWDQVQQARRYRDEKRLTAEQLSRHGGGRKHASLLTGWLECDICKSRTFARHKNHRTTWRYTCNSARKEQPELPDGVKPNHLSRSCEVVDEFTVTAFLAFVAEHRDEILGTSGVLDERIREQEAVRDGAQRELDELARLKADGVITASRWAAAGQPEEDRRDKAIRELERLRMTSLSPLQGLAGSSDPQADWDDLGDDLETQRAMLGLVLDKVVIKSAGWSSPEPADVPEGSKWCHVCGTVKDRDDFHNSSEASDGKVTRCKQCAHDDYAARRDAKAAGVQFQSKGRLPAVADITIVPIFKQLGAGSDARPQVQAGGADRGAA